MSMNPRMTALFGAIASIAATLWIAAPAAAAESNPSGKQAAGVVGVKTASAPVGRHHVWPRWRVTSLDTYHIRYADAAPDGLQPVYWSGRPVLLMIGIGY